MTTTADVLLDGTPVAILDATPAAGLAQLTYDEAAFARWPAGAPVLSTRLPLRTEPYPGTATRSWLDGLLPEGTVRTLLARRAGVDESDLFGLLIAFGRDCAGAVSVVPTGAGPLDDAPSVLWLTDAELADRVRALPRAPFGSIAGDRVRVSLGGIQGKLAVVVGPDGRIGLPEGMQASTHILKPTPTDPAGNPVYPGIVTAEAFGLNFCRALGLDAAPAVVRPLDTGPALLVTRYDRVTAADGTVSRLHQEDFCQALGLTSVDKYQHPLRPLPSLAAIVAVFRNYQAATIPLLREVLGRVAAYALLTNCDAHAKNWAAVLTGNRVELAPAYDVVSSTLWPTVDTGLALHVGACTLSEDLRWHHLADEAATWGMGRRAARSTLNVIRDRCEDAVTDAATVTANGGGDAAVLDRITGIVNRQLQRMGPPAT